MRGIAFFKLKTGIFHYGNTAFLPRTAIILSIIFVIILCIKGWWLFSNIFTIEYVNEYLISKLNRDHIS